MRQHTGYGSSGKLSSVSSALGPRIVTSTPQLFEVPFHGIYRLRQLHIGARVMGLHPVAGPQLSWEDLFPSNFILLTDWAATARFALLSRV